MFCKNMNKVDQTIRGLGGLILIAISPAALDLMSGSVMGWFCLIFGAANLFAALFGWCFMYALVGISSSSGTEANVNRAERLTDVDFKSLRYRAITGFSAIALITSVLFTLEAIQATKETSLRFEVKALHEITTLVTEEIEGTLERSATSDSSLREILTPELLIEALYHFDEPMVLFLGDSDGWIRAEKQLPETIKQQLFTKIPNLVQLPLTEIASDAHDADVHAQMLHQRELLPGLQIELSGQHYTVMSHDFTDTRFGNLRVVLGRISSSEDEAIHGVLSRLGLSSLIVIWLSLWGAVGVSYFIWRYVAGANNLAYRAATTDRLTGLPNDLALNKLLSESSLLMSHREYKIIGLHLRNLSNIAANTSLAVYEELMSNLGERLRQSLDDDHYLARLNDSTLLMITPEEDLSSVDKFRNTVNQIQWVGDFQFTLEPTEVQLSYPTDVRDFEELRTAVSKLVVSANQMHLSVIQYDLSIIESSDKRSDYASEIHQALERREFELYLQPKVDAASGEICGAEALIRWNHPTDGLLAPGQFLAVIEQSNARSNFSKFVIEEAARMAEAFHAEGKQIPISFNLNAYDLLDPNVQAVMISIAKHIDLKENPLLEIELTETQTSINTTVIMGSLSVLSWLGYTIALDDFGTGMSSLSYTHRLPINTIKIDRSFVKEMDPQNDNSIVPIETVLFLARSYGYSVVAEGVETEAQSSRLIELGCQICQGYYFARPVPFAEFRRLLVEGLK